MRAVHSDDGRSLIASETLLEGVVPNGESPTGVGVGAVNGEARLEKGDVDDSTPLKASHTLEGVVLDESDIEVCLGDSSVEEALGATCTLHHIVSEEEAVMVVGDNDRVLDLEVAHRAEGLEEGDLVGHIHFKVALGGVVEALTPFEEDIFESGTNDTHKAFIIFEMEERGSESVGVGGLVLLCSS